MADEPTPQTAPAAPTAAPDPTVPESPLGPDFAAAKAAAFAAAEAEAGGDGADVPDADGGSRGSDAPPTPDATPAGEQPPATGAEEAGDEDRPLTRRERAELRELRKRTQEQATTTTTTAGVDAEALAEVRRIAGLDGGGDGAPDYATLDRLTKARDYDGLARLARADGQPGGYSLEEGLAELQRMETVQRALSGSARFFETRAYAAVGSDLDAAATALGLDPVETAASAKSAVGSPVAAYLKRLVDAAEARGAEQRAQEAADWKGRYEAEAAAHKATRAGRAAGRASVEGGGSSAGGRGMGGVLQQVLSATKGTDDFIERAKRGEFRDLDLTD